MQRIHYLSADGTFSIDGAENYSGLYLPIAGNAGLKSAVTPNFGGDSKIDQETFLLEPVTIDTLYNTCSTRNFWCRTDKAECWSATGVSAEAENLKFTPAQDTSTLTAGFMWQTVRRTSRNYGLESEVTAFVPVKDAVEILRVRICNTAQVAQTITPIAAVPLYGRSADNVRDHRNVTSMLHRIRTTQDGVLVKPTMSFDEKGHRENHRIYYALGCTGEGASPVGFYPTVDAFIGEGGSFLRPRAVYEGTEGVLPGASIGGREAMGGLIFPKITLLPGQSAEYLLLLGIANEEEELERVFSSYGSAQKADAALSVVREYWQQKVNVRYHTGNEEFDRMMRWVSFQPILRRIYGCSFLPHHDYGRGGRGWRDLWQDCLSLLLMDPDGVGDMIRANFGGVRMDGTNATIIGDGDGNFIADRNGIARVWMDHALWPLMTVKLYIHQTGDIGILNVPAPYFKDAQVVRGTEIDPMWHSGEGSQQQTNSGAIYQGTILEHLLIQQLTSFYEVGTHNICRLRDADWNDALDMAAENGESVAFTCAYAGNLRDFAILLRRLAKTTGQETTTLLEETRALLFSSRSLYESVAQKNEVLHTYARKCVHGVSGRTISVSLTELADDLDGKAAWLMEHLRSQEWIDNGEGGGWFNSYYDNHGRPVEGFFESGVRMMLIGQVFAIMSGTANDAQVQNITNSADRYLYSSRIGGYRLNTDFKELKFDMGRMFGFAYGEKENGAVFSHMAVMYASALYRRGYAREGYKALQALADASLCFERSKMYPGIPEYFNREGRGAYCYLTGAASWYMLTVITEVFGVRGMWGDLAVCPKLVREQFDSQGSASLSLPFAGKTFYIKFFNPSGSDYGAYHVARAILMTDASPQAVELPILDGAAILRRTEISRLPVQGNCIEIELAP